MPQLEQTWSYIGQVFWLAVTFGLLYLVMWKSALPKVANVLRERQERVDNDLERAEALKKDAEIALAAYEQSLNAARAKAQGVLREAAEELAREAAARQVELGERLAREGEAAEQRITAAREAALADIRNIAGAAAQLAATRLTGLEVAPAEANEVVTRVVEERG
jgi:F-type H+-transporting ATPase subunit b